MRTLSVVEFVTLDGVMQGLGSPDEDRDNGFEHGGWGAPYNDEVLLNAAREGMPQTTAYLWGRRTYGHMAAHWPHEPASNPIAKHLQETPKYVVSNTLTSLEWPGTRLISGDIVRGIRDLKADGSGAITVLGSGVLVQTLIEHELIDQYHIFIHPLVLGTGKRLFSSTSRPLRLNLVRCTQTTTGVLLCTYEPS